MPFFMLRQQQQGIGWMWLALTINSGVAVVLCLPQNVYFSCLVSGYLTIFQQNLKKN